ncbi:MAG: DHH family phosphoesterase [Bacteroidia bacterium]|nr:DHH family phosphoesterase [Bacteroidia bacterium]
MKPILELFPLLQQPKNIVITTHQNPDGDAVGSSQALRLYLQSCGHSVTAILPNQMPSFLQWLPKSEEFLIAKEKPQDALNAIQTADFIFCLDYSVIDRINQLGPYVLNAKAPKVLIDHHPGAQDFAEYALYDIPASSTCELIYRFIREAGQLEQISTEIATCIYTGLMTDTGSFRYPCVTEEVHQIAAFLIRKGVQVADVHNAIFSNQTEKRLRFVGYCLYEKLVILQKFQTAYISISLEELTRFGVPPQETEGLVNYALSIQGVKLGVLMMELPDHIKMSFRSIEDFAANSIAAYFHGGGHFHAAGGKSFLGLAETEKKLIELLPIVNLGN